MNVNKACRPWDRRTPVRVFDPSVVAGSHDPATPSTEWSPLLPDRVLWKPCGHACGPPRRMGTPATTKRDDEDHRASAQFLCTGGATDLSLVSRAVRLRRTSEAPGNRRKQGKPQRGVTRRNGRIDHDTMGRKGVPGLPQATGGGPWDFQGKDGANANRRRARSCALSLHHSPRSSMVWFCWSVWPAPKDRASVRARPPAADVPALLMLLRSC